MGKPLSLTYLAAIRHVHKFINDMNLSYQRFDVIVLLLIHSDLDRLTRVFLKH